MILNETKHLVLFCFLKNKKKERKPHIPILDKARIIQWQFTSLCSLYITTSLCQLAMQIHLQENCAGTMLTEVLKLIEKGEMKKDTQWFAHHMIDPTQDTTLHSVILFLIKTYLHLFWINKINTGNSINIIWIIIKIHNIGRKLYTYLPGGFVKLREKLKTCLILVTLVSLV